MESWKREGRGKLTRSAAVLLMSATVGSASAFTIPTGNSDLNISLDTTVRYNLGVRTESRDSRIANNPEFDQSDYRFDSGDVVTNRLDLLSELDVVYKNVGFRVSGAAWYDEAYDDEIAVNPALADTVSYNGSRLPNSVTRWYEGPSGEILDAFVFGTFDIGPSKLSLRAGRHTVYWGESLFNTFHSVSYGISPLDQRKALGTPGTEAQELFMPRTQLSALLRLNSNLSLEALYGLEFRPSRLPEAGTYLGLSDSLFLGPDRAFTGFRDADGNPIFMPVGDPDEPDDKGDVGLRLSWSPDAFFGTFLHGSAISFTYRRFDENLPWLMVNNAGVLRPVYAENTQLFGIGTSFLVGDASVGVELSYRRNTGFNSDPGLGDEGARGDSVHLVVNTIAMLPRWAGAGVLYDEGNMSAELTYSRYVKVRSNNDLFLGEDRGACRAGGLDKWDGCATKDYVGLAFQIVPQWNNVLSGILPATDLQFPIFLDFGIYGNSAVNSGGNQGAGMYSIGPVLDIAREYKLSLTYTDYLGHFSTRNGVLSSANGGLATLTDRGWVSLTFQTTF